MAIVYCTREDIEAAYGADNVKQWADLDNKTVENDIAARIDAAIAAVTEDITSRFRGSIYQVPLTTDGNGTVPALVVTYAALLAGVWLYESRGVQDHNPETGQISHRLEWQRKRVDKFVDEVLSGKRQLDATKTVDVYPKGAANEVPDDTRYLNRKLLGHHDRHRHQI